MAGENDSHRAAVIIMMTTATIKHHTLPADLTPAVHSTEQISDSAPTAVATVLVETTSERHPYRLAANMSLC